MERSIQVIIPIKILSQNATQYSHWKKYYEYKRMWEVALRAKLGSARRPPPDFARCTIESLRSRTMDHANLVGGAKPIPDILQKLGYIADDSPEHFHCEYIQTKCKRSEERTIIWINYTANHKEQPQ